MKKLILIIAVTLAAVISYGQAFPVTNAQGAPNTLSFSKGGIQAGVGIINTTYTDTTTANLNTYLKNYAGAQIYTTSDNNFWLRNTAVGVWVKQGSLSPLAQSTFLYGFASTNTFSDGLVQALDSVKCNILQLPDSVKNMGAVTGLAKYGWVVYDAAIDVKNDIRIIINNVDQTDYFTKSTIHYTNTNGLTKDYIARVQTTPTYSTYDFNLLSQNRGYVVSDTVFSFGVNEPSGVSQFQSTLTATNTYQALDTFWTGQYMGYARYPGGTATRWYFWDRAGTAKNLGEMASKRVADYYDAAYTASCLTSCIAKLADKATTNRNRTVTINAGDYTQFLQFCLQTGRKPLISLNTNFYRDRDTVYPITQFQDNLTSSPINIGFQTGRWDSVKKTIQAQVVYTHSILNQNIIWEIGNENYNLIPADEYADELIKYYHYIKDLYPNDKVCATINSASEDQPNPNRNKNKIVFDETIIKTLTDSSLLNNIDYWIKHYYYNNQYLYSAQDSINKVVNDNYIGNQDSGFIAQARGEFPDGYNLRMLITEFQEIDKWPAVGVNSQVSALILFDYFLKFKSQREVQNITRQSGINSKNGLWYDSLTATTFVGQFNPAITSDPSFKYIIPSGYVSKIFMPSTGKQVVNYFINTQYEALLTKTLDTLYFQVLNFTATANPINLSSYSGTKTYSTYTFDNLDAYYWDVPAHTSSGTLTSTLTLPAHSFTNIKIVQ